MDLAIMHAAVITGFEKEVNDFPLHVCVCCEQLHQRKSVSVISLSDDFQSKIWSCMLGATHQMSQLRCCTCAITVSA